MMRDAMNRSDCPDPVQLRKLLSGEADTEAVHRLEAHMLECEPCAQNAETLFPENEVTAFREASPIQFENLQDELLVEGLIKRAKTFRADSATECPEQTQIGTSLDDEDVAAGISGLLRASSDVSDDLSYLAPGQQPDEIGRLGEYRILQVLGRGGMGVVFRAEDPQLRRQVALKVMKPSIAASKSAKDRFLREAQFTASIEHDHIVHIYQVGEDRGVPFIAMPFLRGESLKTRLEREGRLQQSEVVRIGKEVAAGLSAAHDRGLIHRDIKPDNIWIEEKTGRAKILDFGLVRSVSDDAELTQSGMVLGTPKYMAPEQAQGQNVDHRCDLFSLGSVLYHLATGKPAFEGNNLTATLMAVVHHEPKPIEKVSPDIDPKLAALITELVQKAREQRPQSADAVSQRLAEIERTLQRPPEVSADTAETLVDDLRPSTGLFQGITTEAVSIVTQSTVRRTPPRPPKTNKLAICAGAGGLLLILGILIITIRNKDGKETTIRVQDGVVADVDVQPGSTVTIREEVTQSHPSSILNPKANIPNTATGWQEWPTDAPAPAVVPFDAAQAKQHQQAWADYLKLPVEYTNSIGIKFRLIPPGECMIGSTMDEIEPVLRGISPDDTHWRECVISEVPRHLVILTKPRYLAMYEVTQSEYQLLMGTNPSLYAPTGSHAVYAEKLKDLNTSRHPVENVSWNNAVEFCECLNQREKHTSCYLQSKETVQFIEGSGYRLPTNAEWEFACRAGTTTRYWFGNSQEQLDEAGWYLGNSNNRTHPVGELKANPFAICDLYGSVWEWTQDRWTQQYYSQLKNKTAVDPMGPSSNGHQFVIRGGQCTDPPSSCRSSYRDTNLPFDNSGIGFRLSLSIDAVLASLNRDDRHLEASLLLAEKSKLWPVGPLPAWASEEPRWSIMKESFTIPGVVERPTEFKSIGRWNVDTVHSRGVINVARYSPDSKWLATGSTDGHVRVYEAATMKIHQLLPGMSGQHGAVDLSWHPDGQRIAVAADNAKQLRIWTVDGQLLHEELMDGGFDSSVRALVWTFDGSRLICAGANRLDVRDTNGMVIKSLTEGQPALYCHIGNIAASPNSQRFVTWNSDKARIWNAETFELEETIEIPAPFGEHRVRWSYKDRISLSLPDRLVICAADGSVLKEFPSEPHCAAAWRPDGETLTIWRMDPFDLNTESGAQTPMPGSRLQIGGEMGPVPTAIDWSPDGKHLVLGGGRLAVCNQSLNEVEFDTRATSLPVFSLSLHPDGSQIAAVSQIGDDCVRIWSADGMVQRPMPLNERILTNAQVAWSPDGRHLAVGWPQASHFRIGKPDGDFLTVAGSSVNFAWNPDGTQLAAGLTNGHILITNSDGKITHDLDTGETGGVIVAWSKQGVLVAHVGQKMLRVNPDSNDSTLSLLTKVPSFPSIDFVTWRPDGKEVCMSADLHVNVASGVTERIRRATTALAWAPDGSKYLSSSSHSVTLQGIDGNRLLDRLTNASRTVTFASVWSPDGKTVIACHDQSLLVTRSSDDLQVKWAAVMLPNQKSVTFHVGGSVLDGDRETLEREFAYYAADEQGNVRLLSLSEFEMQTGEEILPVPGRYFDSEYRFAINTGEDWKLTSSNAFTVPGIARAAWSRPGGVSLNMFIQETGAYVDPSWLVNESAKAQEEKLSATVLEKEVRQIAGHDAMWMIVEGPGTGTAITGNGPVKTTQHWIAIPRENDVLVALITSPAGTFASNQKLFLKAMETMALQK